MIGTVIEAAHLSCLRAARDQSLYRSTIYTQHVDMDIKATIIITLYKWFNQRKNK